MKPEKLKFEDPTCVKLKLLDFGISKRPLMMYDGARGYVAVRCDLHIEKVLTRQLYGVCSLLNRFHTKMSRVHMLWYRTLYQRPV